ncbi:hypothetical protein CRUP_007781, partial [Coryphaenoides rupestris]
MEMDNFGCALDKKATDMTVADVYDVAAVVGQEFERMIDRYGCEVLLRLMPKVVRILELLEVLVTRGAVSPEAEELRREVDGLRRERSRRHERERRRQEELELLEDMWRGEVQDLLTQISHLQSENNRLLASLSIRNTPSTEQEPQNEDQGQSEREQQLTSRMRDMVNQHRHELCAKDHELSRRNEDVEALQAQQLRLMQMNQDLRHRLATVESQGKAAVQQRTELEALAQARLQEVGSLQQEMSRLKAQRYRRVPGPETETETETETEVAAGKEVFTARRSPAEASHASTQTTAVTPEPIRKNSLWEECGGGDSGLLDPSVFGSGAICLVDATSATRRSQEEVVATSSLESDGSGEESDRRFTMQELRDVLQEKNELKAQVFMLEEELAYYKSEDLEEEEGECFADAADPDPLCSATAAEPESRIRRLVRSPALAFAKDAFQLTVEDVYDISYVIGRDLLKISSTGEEVSDLQFRIVRVLEMFETLVNKYNLSIEELSLERDNLRSELDRIIKESSLENHTPTVGPNQLVIDLKDPNRPRFTMQELKEVLQERNQLKAQLMVAQEELQMYKSGRLPAEPGMVEIDLENRPSTEDSPTTASDSKEQPKEGRTSITKLG